MNLFILIKKIWGRSYLINLFSLLHFSHFSQGKKNSHPPPLGGKMHAHQNIILIFFILHEIFPNLAEKANVKNVMNLIADIRLEIKCSSGRASFSG